MVTFVLNLLNMLKAKSLLDYPNLFSSNKYENNNKMILNDIIFNS